ncbi:MAG: flippase-like domain-containing protein [Balneolaceae bacterium]|nr:flippase-like domain-containing protein [Balneolaceae bacterium]
MLKKTLKTTIALAIGGVFLWLAFRNVRIEEVWEYAKTISFWWILPFAITLLLSNILRAERWRLLIEHEKKDLDHVTLVAGVLTGYLLNMVGPRFGEVSRPVYVAKREGLNSSKLIGTIVLERIIDLITMILLMIVVAVYLISDLGVLRDIFGNETMNLLTQGVPLITTLWSILTVSVIVLIGYLIVKGVQALAVRVEKVYCWVEKAKEAISQFKDGLLAVREVKRWWMFILYTVLIWTCYTLMSYIPFYMFEATSHLGMLEALTITVISAIGIAIPSPGGLGTYHYFVKQSLKVLFGIGLAAGLTYATITHAATVVMVILFTPIALAIDKWRQSKKGGAPI